MARIKIKKKYAELTATKFRALILRNEHVLCGQLSRQRPRSEGGEQPRILGGRGGTELHSSQQKGGEEIKQGIGIPPLT